MVETPSCCRGLDVNAFTGVGALKVISLERQPCSLFSVRDRKRTRREFCPVRGAVNVLHVLSSCAAQLV